MSERVSVAIATYNGAKYLREQLDSLYTQTRIPDEVVVSDDNSSDGTIKILEEYKQRYGLIYSINSKSLGVNKNFEKAIRACSGDYIIICDQDDIWFPRKIELTLSKLLQVQGDNPALVSSQCLNSDENCIPVSNNTFITKDTFGYAATLLYPAGVSQGCTMMFNRKLLNTLHSFPENILYDVYIGLVSASIGVKYNLAESLMYYRHHGKQVTSSMHSKFSIAQRILYRLHIPLGTFEIPNERFSAFQTIFHDYREKFTPQVASLYDLLLKLSNERSRWKKIGLVWRIKEYSIKERLNYTITIIVTPKQR